MSLTTDDLNAVRAQWEEWTAGSGFTLSMEVCVGAVSAAMARGDQPMAHIEGEMYYVVVEVHKREPTGVSSEYVELPISAGLNRRVFSERVPYDAAALRASVSVLARAIAGYGSGDLGE